ncbi:MAG: heparan-alpha-glucosaminide N-acetyltransferase domain-containing protein [Candidatus Eiseniibacteriota bacterium]
MSGSATATGPRPIEAAEATGITADRAAPGKRPRFRFVDEFRGLVGVLMLLGHCSYYFHFMWLQLDPLDPVFGDHGQFWLRYVGYLCAPGFLMMNGAMVWYSYHRRVQRGHGAWSARWHLIQRGLFLVLVQITWVNSSWGGFERFHPGHLGIIACIGLSMVALTFLVHTRWPVRLAVALGCLAIHPLLLAIPYDVDTTWQRVLMQTFVDSGDWNKYPVIPWFVLATLGSVMATGWIDVWKTTRRRVTMSLLVALAAFAVATTVRMGRGYGNIWPFSELWSYSFVLDQKYPPSIYHVVWFFGAVVGGMAVIQALGRLWPRITGWLGIVGRVPLFFYCVHIGILGIFSKRIDIYYREGGELAVLVGLAVMLAVMLPLAAWFGGVKRRSKNYLIRMI